MPRYFTVEEATALLPEIAPILEQIIDLRARLERTDRDLLAMHWKARSNGHVRDDDGLATGHSNRAELLAEINTLIARINGLGVEVKDPSIGLIDFPALREGRVVYLCWRLGESEIGYWHDLDTGYAGRQPL